jgi:hypothetical protein
LWPSRSAQFRVRDRVPRWIRHGLPRWMSSQSGSLRSVKLGTPQGGVWANAYQLARAGTTLGCAVGSLTRRPVIGVGSAHP